MGKAIVAEETVEVQEDGKKRRTGLKWLVGVLSGLLVLVGGGYVAAYFIAGNQVPRHADVQGVAIGGLSPSEAQSKLEAELGPLYTAPITLQDDQGTRVELDPAESGLTADYEEAIIDAGGGFSWHPLDIFNSLTGGSAVDLPLDVDEEQLRAALEGAAPEFSRDAVDATLGYEEGEIARTDGEDAAELDLDAAQEAVETAFYENETEVEAPLSLSAPDVTTQMVDDAVEAFAEPAISGPVTVGVAEDTLEVTPAQIAAVTTFSADGNGLAPSIDAEQLFELTEDARGELSDSQAKNASYRLRDGSAEVIPGETGVELTADALAAAVLTGAVESGEGRSVDAEVSEQQPEFSTEDAERLKPTEVIGEFSTNYPHAAYRNTNIGRAAELMNGTVILPGETFSFNDTLGARTPANGFVDGYVIENGALVRASGGGISQAATTAYNAGFFAGWEDIEHKPHSLYFPRYPAGREATVVWGAVDLKFRNDTEYPGIIQAWIRPSSSGNQGSITVRIWSQPTWDDITATDTVRSNYTSGTTRESNASNCEPQAPAQGFTASYKRQFWRGGSVAQEQSYRWTYSPADRIVCV